MLAFHLATAAALGLASGLHCFAMCGPLALSACSTGRRTSGTLAAGYFAGRLAGYAALGAVAGGLGHPLAVGPAARYVRIAAGLIVGLVLARTALRWLAPPSAPAPRPVPLRARQPRWQALYHRFARLLPSRGLGLGLATALFPCGALYGGLLAAAASGSPTTGAAMMLVFALATAPALVVPVAFGARLSRVLTARGGRLRALFAVGMLVLAVFTAVAPLHAAPPAPDGAPACHGSHELHGVPHVASHDH